MLSNCTILNNRKNVHIRDVLQKEVNDLVEDIALLQVRH